MAGRRREQRLGETQWVATARKQRLSRPGGDVSTVSDKGMVVTQ